ncbi:type IV secretory system conjugative DNA transfer family protein [Tsukamurella hominis]|uniref:type IV secretory system conjugative DNA transfer family protein n=1 Tax=Tsukamurella hominis TaxID=1970232 RepID=UPI0039E80F41
MSTAVMERPETAPRPPQSPYCGLVQAADREGQDDHRGYRFASTGPHLLVSGPTGVGKTRRVLAPAAAVWQGPAVVVSSKRDLMELVAQKRYGEACVIDLRPISGSAYPADLKVCRIDPTISIETVDDALIVAETLIAMSAVGFGGSTEQVTDGGLWDSVAEGPLAAILYYCSPASVGGGIPLALEIAENLHEPEDAGPNALPGPSWESVADQLSGTIIGRRLGRVLTMDARQRDSVALALTKALTPWVREAVRNEAAPAFDIRFLNNPDTTLYLLAPPDGSAAGAAVALLESIIRTWRELESAGELEYRLLMVIDELPNTAPLPKLATYVGEARGLGVALVAAVQATSQFDVKFGHAQAEVLRDIFPAFGLLYGAPEKDIIEQASMWAGLAERRTEAFTQNSSERSHEARFGNLIEWQEMLPTSKDYCRLIIRGTPGVRAYLPDWSKLWPMLERYQHTRVTGTGNATVIR